MCAKEPVHPRKKWLTVKSPFFGYEENSAPTGFGLAAKTRRVARNQRSELALHMGNSHILSLGATGTGKTNMVNANLMLYPGSVLAVDIRGDSVRATERFRREELGQATFVVDPFGVTGIKSARLDPMDVGTLPRVEPESEAQTMAEVVVSDHKSQRDPFWHTQAANLISSNMAYALSQTDPAKRSMNAVVDALFTDDVAYSQAVLLDTCVPKDSFAYKGIASFLGLPDGNAGTRACVVSSTHSALFAYRSNSIRKVLGPSDINLNDLLEGKPMTIYLVLPLERLASHGVVLKLWLEVLLQVLVRRTHIPALPTMVIIDEAAQIGNSPAMKTCATYLRASGVRLWTMWQDLSQIQALYPTDWRTLVNNTSALTFMPGTGLAARELAELVGIPPAMISNLESNEQLVCETGKDPRVVRLAQYWKDRLFEGRHDSLERYSLAAPTAVAR